MIIDDFNNLKFYIRNYNYFHVINPYIELFLQKDNTKFFKNTKSSDLIKMYDFDNEISKIFLDAILRLEKRLNTNVAYMIIYDFNLIDKCLFRISKEELRIKVFTNLTSLYKDNMTINEFVNHITKFCDINTRTKDYNI